MVRECKSLYENLQVPTSTVPPAVNTRCLRRPPPWYLLGTVSNGPVRPGNRPGTVQYLRRPNVRPCTRPLYSFADVQYSHESSHVRVQYSAARYPGMPGTYGESMSGERTSWIHSCSSIYRSPVLHLRRPVRVQHSTVQDRLSRQQYLAGLSHVRLSGYPSERASYSTWVPSQHVGTRRSPVERGPPFEAASCITSRFHYRALMAPANTKCPTVPSVAVTCTKSATRIWDNYPFQRDHLGGGGGGGGGGG